MAETGKVWDGNPWPDWGCAPFCHRVRPHKTPEDCDVLGGAEKWEDYMESIEPERVRDPAWTAPYGGPSG
jgi:hypothetical protein